MGDEPSQMDASVAAPTSRKRELPDADGCDGGALERVAEIVMVLEIMGRMRGGSDPTALEKGLAAEARRKLVTMCESFRPNDLFTSDAARILAGDLGFNPARDQTGNRPIRKQLSIAEKISITKKKMEESRESKVQTSPYPPPHPVVGAGMKPDHRAAAAATSMRPHRISSDKQNQIPTPIGAFQQGSQSTLASNSSFKTLPLNDMHKSLSTSKPAGGPAEDPHFRGDPRTGALSYPVQVQGNHLLDRKSNTSATYQPTVAKPTQVVNAVDLGAAKVEIARPINPYQTSSPVVKDQGLRGPPPVVIQGNTQDTGQQSHDLHRVGTVASNDEIAILIHKLLRPKPTDLSSWSPPSVNYMGKPLHCQVCKINITDSESLLVCDACEKGTHLGCLKLLSQRAVSNVEWYCPSCLHSSNGKPFPPKYGRVTRSNSAGKATNPSGMITVPEKPTGSSVPKVSHQNTIPNVNAPSSKPAALNASGCSKLTQAVKNINALEGQLKSALAHHTDQKAEIATSTNQIEGEDGSTNSRSMPNETSSQVSLTTDASVTTTSGLTIGENTNMPSDSMVEHAKMQSDSVVHPGAGEHSYCPSSTQGTDIASGSNASDN